MRQTTFTLAVVVLCHVVNLGCGGHNGATNEPVLLRLRLKPGDVREMVYVARSTITEPNGSPFLSEVESGVSFKIIEVDPQNRHKFSFQVNRIKAKCPDPDI